MGVNAFVFDGTFKTLTEDHDQNHTSNTVMLC